MANREKLPFCNGLNKKEELKSQLMDYKAV